MESFLVSWEHTQLWPGSRPAAHWTLCLTAPFRTPTHRASLDSPPSGPTPQTGHWPLGPLLFHVPHSSPCYFQAFFMSQWRHKMVLTGQGSLDYMDKQKVEGLHISSMCNMFPAQGQGVQPTCANLFYLLCTNYQHLQLSCGLIRSPPSFSSRRLSRKVRAPFVWLIAPSSMVSGT